MEDDSHARVNNIKRGVRACHKEMLEIAELLGNGDPLSRRQATMRMNNMKKLADSIYKVLERWDEELEKEEEDRKDFILSVMEDIEIISTKGLDLPNGM